VFVGIEQLIENKQKENSSGSTFHVTSRNVKHPIVTITDAITTIVIPGLQRITSSYTSTIPNIDSHQEDQDWDNDVDTKRTS
jgi:hypothetical protein